jgi:hypothetical protein
VTVVVVEALFTTVLVSIDSETVDSFDRRPVVLHVLCDDASGSDAAGYESKAGHSEIF